VGTAEHLEQFERQRASILGAKRARAVAKCGKRIKRKYENELAIASKKDDD
jgi:hypothetical protein